MKDLAVELLVILVRALAGHTCPQRIRVVDRLRRRLLRHRGRFLALFSRLLHRLLMVLDPALVLFLAALHGCLSDILEIDRRRHEAAVFLQYLANPVLVAELQRIIIEIQRDLRADVLLRSFPDGILGLTVALPVHRLRAFFIAQRVDVHLIGHHEGGIEPETEMADDLVRIFFVLEFLEEFCRAGEGDLGDVLHHLVFGHTDAVVDEFQCLLVRIHHHVYFIPVVLRRMILADSFQLLQLRDRVARIRDLLAHEDVMIGIQPFLDDRKHIFTVNR